MAEGQEAGINDLTNPQTGAPRRCSNALQKGDVRFLSRDRLLSMWLARASCPRLLGRSSAAGHGTFAAGRGGRDKEPPLKHRPAGVHTGGNTKVVIIGAMSTDRVI